jgi:hypothetical protein
MHRGLWLLQEPLAQPCSAVHLRCLMMLHCTEVLDMYTLASSHMLVADSNGQ